MRTTGRRQRRSVIKISTARGRSAGGTAIAGIVTSCARGEPLPPPPHARSRRDRAGRGRSAAIRRWAREQWPAKRGFRARRQPSSDRAVGRAVERCRHCVRRVSSPESFWQHRARRRADWRRSDSAAPLRARTTGDGRRVARSWSWNVNRSQCSAASSPILAAPPFPVELDGLDRRSRCRRLRSACDVRGAWSARPIRDSLRRGGVGRRRPHAGRLSARHGRESARRCVSSIALRRPRSDSARGSCDEAGGRCLATTTAAEDWQLVVRHRRVAARSGSLFGVAGCASADSPSASPRLFLLVLSLSMLLVTTHSCAGVRAARRWDRRDRGLTRTPWDTADDHRIVAAVTSSRAALSPTRPTWVREHGMVIGHEVDQPSGLVGAWILTFAASRDGRQSYLLEQLESRLSSTRRRRAQRG